MSFSKDILTAALAGLEAQRDRLDGQIRKVRSLMRPGIEASAPAPTAPRKRKKFSAAIRKKMKLAQQARWEKIRAGEAKKA